ncbi:DNA sulfur modification protein DndB [Bacillus thuringiensis serovar brasilensis]|uniref:DNA sulfur modification protein DndB n=1 Tax=Bacillus cereus group TaxID=86661 RepID=UPI000A36B232|nr:DNA sulfur modification protein DndB [Bacillus thuringiensis]MCU5031651.1 DNA sulfur modification protein DndB [Bacillus cereus]MRA74596.1 DGQHR domain-containing protein [Bacillus thuringiensis]MRA92459.1 DGQHR domain-containing protein [Bacillus thuringiensis]MRC54746.1 DGQHR domain-containing protein [Bacillus thuringiensis]OTX38932.1 DNA sulfur modification protein DndB [Bacillus thuringiensis serovar brasilensis]
MTFTVNKVKPMNLGSTSPALTIPCIKYFSGKRDWYAISIPYKVLGKFIQTSAVKKKNQEIIKANLKNRFLDLKHKNEIKQYIIEEEEFTIPPITLVSYDELDFRPFEFVDANTSSVSLDATGSVCGVIVLPIDYEFECLDGNHRTVAIRELASENPEYIADSSIMLNIVHDKRPRKIRQDFVDVNRNAKQTTSSINTLFNTRDKMSGLVVDVIENFDYLKETTELLATNVSKNSKDIYTINNIKNAVIEIAGFNSQNSASQQEKKISQKMKQDELYTQNLKVNVFSFFEALKENLYINDCIKNRDKTADIRNESLISSGTGLIIASRVFGQALVKGEKDQDWINNVLQSIIKFNWSRKNPDFMGGVITPDYKITNSRESINMTYELINEKIGILD